MIERIRFRREHIAELQLHESVVLPADRSVYERYSWDAQTVLVDDKPVACFGAVPAGRSTMQLWMLTSEDCKGPVLLHLTRYVEDEWFPNMPATKLECVVHNGFEQGHRWIKMLGFEKDDSIAPVGGWVDETFTDYSRTIAWAA